MAQGLSGLSDLQPRQRLGRYQLEVRIGEGAFAEVWRAVEIGGHGFRKRVALKILKQDGDDPEQLNALLDEARLCGHLHHPSLVDVYGVGSDQGHTFVTMEWVDGISLYRLLSEFRHLRLRIPPSAAIQLGIQLCGALAHAHAARDHDGKPLYLIHRDLKPGNILLTWTGQAKITDWGIAKATITDRSTQIGMLKGTPSYIAPEVWLGHREFKPATDLFAIGAVLWEVVTGEVLIAGDIPVIIGIATHGDVDEDIQRLRMFSPELCPVVRELLQRDPDKRLNSAVQAKLMLEEAARQLPPGGGLDALMEVAAPILGRGSGQVGLTGRVAGLVDTGDHCWAALLASASSHGLDLDADQTLVSSSFGPVQGPMPEPPTRRVPIGPSGSKAGARPTVRPSLFGAGIAAVLFTAMLGLSQWAATVGTGDFGRGSPVVGTAPPEEPAGDPGAGSLTDAGTDRSPPTRPRSGLPRRLTRQLFRSRTPRSRRPWRWW
jgi:serine/threonine-protein kinase